jgi:hypothetical protein
MDASDRNVLIDERGALRPWVGDGCVTWAGEDTLNGEKVAFTCFREDAGLGWHRAGMSGLGLAGPQTHAVAVRPVGRTSVFMQSLDAGVVVAFDLDNVDCATVAGNGEIRQFVREIGGGWYLCAVGFDCPGPVSDLSIGICKPETDTHAPYQGYAEMGIDVLAPMSVAGIGVAHPLLAIEFSEDSQARLSRNQRAERILSARRGLLAEKKRKIALAKPSPKLIVVGASSVLYGVRATVLERQLGIPAANLGVVAGLRLTGMLKLASDTLQRGDICVLALELFFFAKGWPQPDGANLNNDVYFDACGDFHDNPVAHRTPEMRARVAEGPAFAAKWHYYFNPNGKAAAALRSFAAWARDNGIMLYYVWPVMYAPSLEPARQFIADLDRFYRSLGLVVLGKPTDAIYPLDWFFDTNNHLHGDAAIKHSRRMARKLRRAGVGVARSQQWLATLRGFFASRGRSGGSVAPAEPER